MNIEFKQGFKHPLDKIILINGEQIKFIDLAAIVLQLCINEDNIYPKPKYRGGQMLIDFLQEVYAAKEITNDIKKRYNLK